MPGFAISARALLDHMERSILTRTVRGDLVAQDPAYKPATFRQRSNRPEDGFFEKERTWLN